MRAFFFGAMIGTTATIFFQHYWQIFAFVFGIEVIGYVWCLEKERRELRRK